MKESDLYPPLKSWLEGQGYVVKAEIGACDILARRGDEPPLVVEMKRSFTLSLVLQGVARLSLFDTVYLAVPLQGARGWPAKYRDITALCRRLGLGLLAVRIGRDGAEVEAHLDPGPYAPRKSAPRAGKLLREFDRRVGDPNLGGTTGVRRMTAYRQDALRCAAVLAEGPMKAAQVAKRAAVARAGDVLRDDHYRWFERVERGVYALTARGRAALETEHAALKLLGLTNGAPLQGL